MRHRRPARFGVRTHLAALALVALLPAWGLAGVTAWRFAATQRSELLRAGQDAARNIAALAEAEAAALRASAAVLATSGSLAQGDLAAFHQQASLFLGNEGVQVLVLDADGRQLLNTGAMPGATLPRVQVPAGTGVTGLQADLGTGRRAILFTRPVAMRGQAQPVQLVVATDSLRIWSLLLQRAALPEGWVASMLDHGGTIFARVPEADRFLGQRAHPDALALLHADPQARDGWARGSTRDAAPVYVAWRRLQDLPWTVLVGVPQAAVDGALQRILLPVLALGAALLAALTFGIATWAARRLGRPLHALERAANAFGHGFTPALPPPSGVREVDAVGLALVSAANERRHREAETSALAERLESVLESTTDAVLVLDRTWRIAYLNGRARASLAEGRDLVGESFWAAFPEVALGAFAACFRAAMDSGVPGSCTAEWRPLGWWFTADAFASAEGLTIFCRDVSDSRRAEAALRDGEARLQAVLAHVPVGVALAEAPSGRIVMGNQRLEEIFGHRLYAADSIAEYARYQALTPEGRPMPPEQMPLARALLTGQQAEAEMRYRRGDGDVVWLRAHAAPILAPDGTVTGAVLAVVNVDAEHRGAEALRESELRFRTLSEAVPQIVWSGMPDGRLDYINPRFFEFTGLPMGTAAPDVEAPIHGDDRLRVRRLWAQALDAGQPYQAEYRMRRHDGAWRWFVGRALPARDAAGRIRRWIGTATDVTELVETRQQLERQVAAEAAARQAVTQAAEALAVSEERFRRFADASPDVLWILDAANDRLDYLSPAYERLWAGPPYSSRGSVQLAAGAEGDDIRRIETALARAAAGEPLDLEYRIRDAAGRQRWLRLMGFPMHGQNGAPGRVGGFVRDITSRKEADERQRLLIAELNHRVKNTLATVQSLARQTVSGALASEAGGGDSKRVLDRYVEDFQARLMALARGHDLLTARTWRGAMMTEVAAAALAPWRNAPDDGGALRIGIDGPPVWLAPKQALGLALALHELATNAAKHGALSHPHGQVMLHWWLDSGGEICLEWRESGGGPVNPPQRRGFGTRLLQRGLPAELGPGSEVTLDYAPAGFTARARFRPAEEGVGE